MVTAIGSLFFGNHVDIPRVFQRAAILPEVLTREALDSIARHGIANFTADRYAKAAALAQTGFEESDKVLTVNFPRMRRQMNELGAREQSIVLGKAVPQ
ncbi:MAG: hypothetical protein WAU91_02525 [Desulfatitalea sp.]